MENNTSKMSFTFIYHADACLLCTVNKKTVEIYIKKNYCEKLRKLTAFIVSSLQDVMESKNVVKITAATHNGSI